MLYELVETLIASKKPSKLFILHLLLMFSTPEPLGKGALYKFKYYYYYLLKLSLGKLIIIRPPHLIPFYISDYYMLFDSRRFILGKLSYLLTPKIHLNPGNILEFWAHMKIGTNDNIAAITVYIANEVGFDEHELDVLYPTGEWTRHEIKLSVASGTYQIGFRATCGQPFESDIAVDHIQIIGQHEDIFSYSLESKGDFSF